MVVVLISVCNEGSDREVGIECGVFTHVAMRGVVVSLDRSRIAFNTESCRLAKVSVRAALVLDAVAGFYTERHGGSIVL